MQRRRVVPVLALALLAASAEGASAQLWKNGSFDGFSALSSERNSIVSDSRVYDNFIVSGGGWFVTSLFGDFITDFEAETAYWEIRTGLGLGFPGVLLFSGTNDVIDAIDLGDAFGYGRRLYTVGGFGPFALDPGEYWLAIAPIGDGGGRAFVATTDGSNGINALLDGKFFWDSPYFGVSFTDEFDEGVATDFAYGLNGSAAEAVVPEPSSLILLGTGLGLFALVGWRRHRRKH